MRTRHLLLLAIVALLSVACSQTPDTIVVGNDGTADAPTTKVSTSTTVPGERPADVPTTMAIRKGKETQAAPEKEPPLLQQAEQTTTTVADIEPQPTEPRDEEIQWEDRPLAHVVLTADDMPALGLDSGWEFNWIDFIELDPADHVEEEVCGTAVPVQPSYFVVSFDAEELGTSLKMNVMPDFGGSTAADFMHLLELMATCEELEEEWTAVSVDIVAIEVEGAEKALLLTGTDKTQALEPIGLTMAVAEVEGHLFMAFVEQDSGRPAPGDNELAIKALELSISRL